MAARSAQGGGVLFSLLLAACGDGSPAAQVPGPMPGPVQPGASGADASLDAASDAASGAAPGAQPEAGAGGGYCASTGPHYFCDDFDEDPLAHDWDQTTVQHGALTLDSSRSTSSPYALLARSPSLASGAVTTASLSKQIVDTPPHLHVAFDFAVDALDPGGAEVTVLVIDLIASDGTLAEVLSVQAASTGGTLVDSDGASFLAQRPFAWPALGTGAWSRIEIDVAYPVDDDGGTDDGDAGAGEGGTVSLSLDGQTALAPSSMAPGSQPSLPVLELGLVSLRGPSAAVAVRFDDFTFATLP